MQTAKWWNLRDTQAPECRANIGVRVQLSPWLLRDSARDNDADGPVPS
ncbi:hypothetical protein [Rubripirellula obstinata]|nr:hypothetical protein [Rubripirellula obstinata]